jgi:4-alpha-glucanotransferase
MYANLYALDSGRNQGVGDLTDLGDMVRWTARDLGGDFVGINPLHAIPNTFPFGISPYASTSRLYTNFIYIDLEKVSDSPEYKSLTNSKSFKNEMQALKNAELIDYEGVAALKMRALRVAYKEFHERHITAATPEAEDFYRYVEAEGESLEGFAAFAAIEEHVKAAHPDLYHWKDWPPEYRDHDGPGVREFIRTHEKEVMFYQYVQWLADRQLSGVFDEAKELGMGVGLYQDLAVGSSGAGSDAWTYPEVFALGMEAGAPPDAFNLNGQAWGFPPLNPERLRESGYELFIQTIRNNLRYSGALRIDHVLGLFRLFWVPEGMGAREGTYVSYPSEDLLRIVALESVRNEAVIIGEDLGTIGDDVREALPRFGMLSYRLFYFERDWSQATFLPPEEYPEQALTAVTTHDLPTLRGYWDGHDIEVKKEIGLYPDEETLERDISERERDRGFIVDTLSYCLPEGYQPPAEMTPELSLCVHRHLARTPCRMVVVSLDDVLGVLNQQNMPGTIDQHPNWRQRCRVELSEVMRNEHAKALSEMFHEEGRG